MKVVMSCCLFCTTEDVPEVEFMDFVLLACHVRVTRKATQSLLLCLCDVSSALINSLVC